MGELRINFVWILHGDECSSDLLSLRVSKDPRLCLELMPLVILCELLAELSNVNGCRGWKAESDHEA